MTVFQIVLIVLAALLAISAVPVVHRMIVGPTILDRAVALDMLVVLCVIGMGLYTAGTGAAWAGPAMLSLTGLAFIATVAVARFVSREDPREGLPDRPASEAPSTDTGPRHAVAAPARSPRTTTDVFMAMRPTDPPPGDGQGTGAPQHPDGRGRT